ncbi:MAG: plastocyanin [Zetaproteobacteria bacterium CG12_big_fil_rev_8_21_14_0_65_54_13]|nr:MAG: plastocyanin [Zetaproteobacteria bacterium CG23_combo_of_CG06-09_8_20_14_all_54_7]PIW51258.1 MAG: plastocyanin [Zetaproteobacteria bacterium CG12_big_fil_rev_8_21_14_0_65_54_13]PIX55308.1 MAG: plastocyanin [Zetaproteobacteria bacterium CG_4_10_14_3_um_filter_54_28]PJA27316.1 MAG: plastocyanin [Zetaproteobacteria bacterium CG_4_9_14_3_um_filter_54_145]
MILVNIAGLLLIGLIIWWFWLYRPGTGVSAAPGQIIEIRVSNGVYEPSLITVTTGKAVSLRFIREDETACAAQVIFPDMGIQKELPLGKPVLIRLLPEQVGDFTFQCQMGMYRGMLRVR